MKILKKLLAVIICVNLLFVITACGNGNSNESKKVYKIGALQLVQHQALDLCYQGFDEYLKSKNVEYTIDYNNASGEQSACQTISQKFAESDLDLIYAIATPAAQSVLAFCENAPIVASAVTDPAASGLVESNQNPGGNLTCASDLTPVEAQFDLLKELIPNAKKVGILYCASEANSKIQADMAIEAAKNRGLEYKEYTIVNSNDLQTVVESMIGNVDVLYVPTDNTVSAGFSTVAQICNDNKLPTIVGEKAMVDLGGYATYGINYYELGKVAGELAYEILVNGKQPKDLPVRYLDGNSCERAINKETAVLLGLKAE